MIILYVLKVVAGSELGEKGFKGTVERLGARLAPPIPGDAC